ncbi:MAG: AAA family ATPase, partial [Rhodomicrobium sp.]
GSIHRANGGYLLLDARSVLLEPFTWAALKRTLRRGEIAIEDIARFLGLTTTVSLEPEPIPLNVKIVLFGDRLLYTIPGREATFLSCSATFSSMPQMRLSPP